jgi:pimeloyl-ACP methyl ester carboxylesterase
MDTTQQRLPVMGCDIHVARRGTGAPVLLLHGNPDSSLVWRGVMARLADRFDCVAPDLPGYGHSVAPREFDYGIESMARWVDELVTALNLPTPLNVAGHDFGGVFALAWTATRPQRVRRIAISNIVFSADYRWHLWARIWRTPLLGELSLLALSPRSARASLKRSSPRLPDAYFDETYGLVTPAVKRRILRLYRTLTPAAFAPWRARVEAALAQVPLAVLWGDGDPYVADAWADDLPAQRVRHFAAAGHWLPVVEPQATADALAEFFAS